LPKPAPVAPTATPPSAPPASQPTAPSTDIEAQKADIEKRRNKSRTIDSQPFQRNNATGANSNFERNSTDIKRVGLSIDKKINNGKTDNEIIQELAAQGIVAMTNTLDRFREFIADRQSGKTTQTFEEWYNETVSDIDAELAALGESTAAQPTVPTPTPAADTVTENAEQIIAQLEETESPASVLQTLEAVVQNIDDGVFLKDENQALQQGFESRQEAIDSFRKAFELYKDRSTKKPGTITLPNGLTVKVDGNTKDSTDISEETFDDALVTLEEGEVETIVAEARELLLEGVSPRTQESLQAYIAADIMKRALAQKEVGGKKSIETLPIFEEHKESLKQLAEFYRANGLPKKAAVLDKIVDQFPKLQTLVNQYMSVLTTGKVDEAMDLDENEEAVGLEKTIYSDDWAFTINSKATASADLRKFFAFVEARDNAGEVKLNELGFPEIIPFDQVYDTLKMLLANKPADLDILMDTLELYTEAFPWVRTVIDNLEKAPEKIKNEFVSDATKHHIGMKFIMWSKDKYGNYTLQRWSSNSSAIEERLRDSWGSNLMKQGSNLILVNEEGDYLFNQEVINDLVTTATEWEKNPKDVTNEELAKWLGNFGITLSDETYKDLRAGKYSNSGRKSWEGLFTASSGLVKVLKEELKSLANNPEAIADRSLLKDSAIKALSKLEALNTARTFSNSFRAGTKTIYSYGNNNYLVNRVRDLTAYDSDNKKFINQDLIDKLQKISFTRDSLWLAALTQDGETGDLMRSSLGVDYLSLEALKRQYTKSQDGRKLNKLTVDEH
jgi:hypothetical protein